MTIKHLIYTASADVYSKTEADSTPWADDVQTVTEDATYAGIYPIDLDHPHVYVGDPPASSDTYLGDASEFYYGTVAGADLYFARRVHAWDWENATLEDKVRALYNATEAIEKFQYVGVKASSSQSLEFPRTRTLRDDTVCQIGGTSGVPTPIIEACYLIADALVGGRDPQADFESQNVKVETFGPTRTELDTKVGPMRHIANLVPSPAAWAKIQPFLAISHSFSVNKA